MGLECLGVKWGGRREGGFLLVHILGSAAMPNSASGFVRSSIVLYISHFAAGVQSRAVFAFFFWTSRLAGWRGSLLSVDSRDTRAEIK